MGEVRHAEVSWSGDLQTGSGVIKYVTSGVFSRLPVSWASRTSAHNGKTSPEELLAAAHAACYSMSLATELTRDRTPPERLDVRSTIVMDEVEGEGHRIVASELRVRAIVRGSDDGAFADAARRADEGCPFSALIRASGTVSIDAILEAS